MAEIIILGAGLTGLSAAYHLEQMGIHDYQIFERDSTIGGLCRTVQQDGFTFDYTGHLLHLNHPYFKDLIYNLLAPENFNAITRRAYIYSQNSYTKYPYQVNLFGLPAETIAACIQGYLERPKFKTTKNFYQWSLKNFGAGITKYFLAPYQNKIFAYDIRKVSDSWTGRFVPQTSLIAMINGAIADQPEITQQIGYNANFIYPKSGGIFAWVAQLSNRLKQPIQTNHSAKTIDLKNKIITFNNGRTEKFKTLISTIPLDYLLKNLVEPSHSNLKILAPKLICNSVTNFNLGVNRPDLSNKHWVYFPEPEYKFYRLGFPHNFTNLAVPANCSSLYGEFSHVHKSPAYIQETLKTALKQVKQLLNIQEHEILTEKIIDIKHAYVIYNQWRDHNLPKILQTLADQQLYSCGRYGAWQYSSMQEAVLDGKAVAENLIS
ncbi:MAG TPA: FAD-dependent oxidoreductase [Candidatus Babeliales bacterium]|nr:FAD-dependent oxidoreductase [Candidatus Babeliales bacterium]